MNSSKTLEVNNKRRSLDVTLLRERWRIHLPNAPIPADRQFVLWLVLHRGDFQIIEYGFAVTAKKNKRVGYLMDNDLDYLVRYASKVMSVERQVKRAVPAVSQTSQNECGSAEANSPKIELPDLPPAETSHQRPSEVPVAA